MKRLFSILLLLIVTLGVSAQNTKNVLEIDQSSFRPVQTDVLKGVTIDAIKVDRSKRPCARIKMHVNRMTREEIDQIAVKTVGGMVELTKRITAAEGNGIIFELTAKPETRFYIHHDKYGDSNEVMVNLEGNKEYRIDAQLNMLLSITVASNTNDAEVYIDEVFKGRTANGSVLTVEDVTPGSHTLKLKYGSSVKEQTINVNSSSIFFRQEVDVAGMQPQWVVFEVEPKDAMIFVDNQPLRNNDGIAEKLFANGDYSWRVMAGGHYEQMGRFTVSGEKVELKVTLKPDGANVTITTDATSEIWVNNQKKGVGSWSGMLLSDTYIFEARKEGHRSTSLTQSITSTPHEQSYTIPAPTPIYGSLNLTSVPSKARLSIDGLYVGETPLLKSVLAGNHTLELSKDGYSTWSKEITVTEGQTLQLSATLQKIATSSTTAASTTTRTITSSTTPTNKVYKVGDYYNDGKKEGVVFWVDPSGKHGKIVSLTESSSGLQWSSDDTERKRYRGANDKSDGAKNMAIVKQIKDWQSKYPAFKWCADLGDGWYLPAIEELKKFTLDNTVYDAVNQTLKTKGKKLANEYDIHFYWSSTEYEYKYRSGEFCAWRVAMRGGYAGNDTKGNLKYVRAVAAVTFGESESRTTSSASATPAIQVASSKTYKVGDYYNENGKKGVVFWVDPSGKHGKIVSLTESWSLQWSSDDAERKRLIGANNKSDGAKNTAVVKKISGWQSKYPAFKWCADLGEGWYLPAIDELKIFMFDNTVHNAVNQTLETKGKKLANKGNPLGYWSSTEYDDKSSSGEFRAWGVYMYYGNTNFANKYNNGYVRAVSAF